jgi:hypothetical protein
VGRQFAATATKRILRTDFSIVVAESRHANHYFIEWRNANLNSFVGSSSAKTTLEMNPALPTSGEQCQSGTTGQIRNTCVPHLTVDQSLRRQKSDAIATLGSQGFMLVFVRHLPSDAP